MKELCILFSLSPSELVEEWIAHVTCVGGNQEPTLSTIGEFERKVSYQDDSVVWWEEVLASTYILFYRGSCYQLFSCS